MSKNDRSVYRRSDGIWVNKKDSDERATSLHTTQKEAENKAREMIRQTGGGELTTHGEDGKIRSKDTISPGNDPSNIKDTEN